MPHPPPHTPCPPLPHSSPPHTPLTVTLTLTLPHPHPTRQRALKGHRPGELTILTGPTGSGKTTLLAQLSLDLAAQGTPTLWGSFEIKAARLLATMAAQLRGSAAAAASAAASAAAPRSPRGGHALPHDAAELLARSPRGGDILLDPEAAGMSPALASLWAEYEAATDALCALPLHVLRFFGSTEVDRVLDALEYAAYVHDVRHVVLDNLQVRGERVWVIGGCSGPGPHGALGHSGGGDLTVPWNATGPHDALHAAG